MLPSVSIKKHVIFIIFKVRGPEPTVAGFGVLQRQTSMFMLKDVSRSTGTFYSRLEECIMLIRGRSMHQFPNV